MPFGIPPIDFWSHQTLIVARLWLEGLLQAQTVLKDCELDDLLGRKNHYFFKSRKTCQLGLLTIHLGDLLNLPN